MDNENKNQKETLTTEIVTRQKYSTDIISFYNFLPDPDPVLRKMGKDISAYRDLLVDPQIGSCVDNRKAGTQSKNWSIDRGKSKTLIAKEIEAIFNDLDIDQFISDILEAPLYGYQPIEIIWAISGKGRLIPGKLKAKPSEWFGFDENNKLCGRPKFSLEKIELPDKKFLCIQHKASLDPHGQKILSRCFWPAVIRKGGLKFWSLMAEKYGMPTLIGIAREGASQEEIDEFADKLSCAVQDAVMVITEGNKVEIKEASATGTGAPIYERLIKLVDGDISKAILGQTLTTDSGNGSGSYALGKVHSGVRQDIVDSDTKLVEKGANQLIRWINELNYNSPEVPVFSMWEEEDVDKDLAERDKILTDSGVRFTKKYYMKNYGFEEEDIDIIETKTSNSGQPTQFSESEKKPETFPDQVAIDNLVDSFSQKDLSKQADELIKPLMQVISESSNFNEAMEKISEIYPDMSSKKLEDFLTKAIFISDVWGRINA